MVCQGHQQELPKLDPEVDISAIQLVGPQTSKEEIQSLYLEVYKQQRLLGSPPREQELMEEVVSSFEDCQGQKQKEASKMAVRSRSTDIQPPRSRTPGRGRREASVERSLAKVREAHQKVLAMVAALEEEIEQLSHPPSGVGQRYGHIQRVESAMYVDPGGKRGGTARCDLRTALLPISNIIPPEGTQIWQRGSGYGGPPFGGAARIGARGHLLFQRVG